MSVRTRFDAARGALFRGAAALALVAGIALPAHGGGPLELVNHQPVVYPNGGTLLTLNLDQGPLGYRTNAQATALAQSAIAMWNGVNTSTMRLIIGSPLAADYTTANYTNVYQRFSDGLNPVIFDTDGSITDAIFGVGAKSSILGFAGSAYWTSGPSVGKYAEGQAFLNGYINISDAVWTVVLAHEFGHFFGLDHSQLDSTQGLAFNNYALMYPIAYRSLQSLHEDDAAAVTALYPAANVGATYGQLTGAFTTAGGTPILGANIWARETSTGKVYSVVSDFLTQGTGYFRLYLPAGTYTLNAESIASNFTGGSGVGPYSNSATSASFQSPHPITPVALGGGSAQQIVIAAGCLATATFRLDGTGSVSGNCGSAPASTTTTLASSANPAVAGSNVTLTATVVGAAPTGTVAFKDGGSAIAGCSGVLLSSNQAQCTITTLTVGSHSITGVYSGDADNATSTSSVLTQTVAKAATTTAITAHTPDPVTLGTSVSVSAGVSVTAPGAGTPTGTIAVSDGSASCTITLPAVSCNLMPTSAGVKMLTATYGGDTSFNGSASAGVSQTVRTVSSTAITSSANPATAGQNVTLTTTVTGASPTGTVNFKDGTTTIGTCGAVALASAQAQCTTNALGLGSHSITAVYSGNASNAGSTSPALSLSIVAGDATPPTVVSLARAGASPTMADIVSYTLTFSESITGLGASNLSIATTGSITGASVGTISGSGTSRTVTINTGRGTGTLRLDVANGTNIVDGANNALAGTPFTSGQTYTIDKGGTVLGSGQGHPDASFGSGGYALFSLSQGVAAPGAIAVLSSGKILAAGGVGCDAGTGTSCTLQLAQYLADGTPDAGFAPNGKVITSVSGINADLSALIANGDGTFFVGGSRLNGPGNLPFVGKFSSNGTPVAAYGTSGLAGLSSLPLGSTITGTAVDASGRVLVAGTKPSAVPQGSDLFVARLTTAGALDATFGSGGVANFGISTSGSRDDLGTDVTVQPDGNIVVGGRVAGTSGFFDFLLLRLTPAGALDTTFGNIGVVTARFTGSTGDNAGRKLALQTDGKIVLVGAVLAGGINQCGVARFNANGTVDATFGTSGQVLIPLTQGCLTATLQADGKLVVAALDRDGDVSYATLARLLANGTPDGGFGTNGMQDISSYTNATKVALTATGNLVTGLVLEDPADGIHKSYVVQLGSQMLPVTTTTITSIAPSQPVTGQAYIVTVSVTAASGTPTGSLVASDGTGASCTIAALAAGSGSCSLTSATAGAKTISASYSGSTSYRASVGTKALTVNAAVTVATIAASSNPVQFGAPVTLTATVTAKAPGAGVPTGTVTFKDGGTTLGTGTLNALGVATMTTSTLAADSYGVTANYGGDTNYKTSKSGTLSLAVQALPTVQFSTSAVSVAEAVGTMTLTVQRVGSTIGPVTVKYDSADVTATSPADYLAVHGTLSWAAGDGTPKTIPITIVSDLTPEPNQTFTVTLSMPSGATLVKNVVEKVTIKSN